MTSLKRLRKVKRCVCGHPYDDHVWGFNEPEPCQIDRCACESYLPDGTPL